ncbi:MAG: heparinase II/III family protein [Planctomycetes bacterium]|nr:heparinase II/III family protein [Planctomycetota bacterium]
MKDSATLLKTIEKFAGDGLLTGEEIAILKDVVNGGNPRAEAIIDFVTAYLPAPFHLPETRTRPGLLADAGELSSIRQRIKSDALSATLWGKLEEFCRNVMTPGSPNHVDYEERKRDELWRDTGRNWTLMISSEHLGWAYRISGDRSYGEYAKGIMLTIARSRHGWRPRRCNYGWPYKGWLNDNSLDLGHSTLSSAITYDLLHDLFSPQERQEMADYFEPFFFRLASWRYDAVLTLPTNSPLIGFSGVGLLALSLADAYPPERRSILDEAVRWARAFITAGLDRTIQEDGCSVEGSAYASASLHYMALFCEGLRRVCGVNLFQHPTWQRHPRYLISELLPGGGAFNNFNDNNIGEALTAFWLFSARGSDNPCGTYIWEHFHGPRGSGKLIETFAVEIPYVLLCRNPATTDTTPQEIGIEPVQHFDQIDHLVMRTGWDADDLHVTFQCTPYGPWAATSHTQADRLNFTLYAKGERFAIDSGYGMIFIPGSSQVHRMGRKGESHNQVIVDGQGQAFGPTKPAPSRQMTGESFAPDGARIERWAKRGEWVWAIGEATAFYANLRTAKRAIVTRLTKHSPLVLVVDWILPEPGEHDFDFLLHSEQGNRFEISGDGSVRLAGCRRQGSVTIRQVASQEVHLRQDEWLDHPRLIASSRGPYLLFLTAIGPDGVTQAETNSDGRQLSWQEASGPTQVTLSWLDSTDGSPMKPSLHLLPLNERIALSRG